MIVETYVIIFAIAFVMTVVICGAIHKACSSNLSQGIHQRSYLNELETESVKFFRASILCLGPKRAPSIFICAIWGIKCE